MKKFLPLALAAALTAAMPFSLACGSAEVVISIAEDGGHYVVEGVVGNRYSLESYIVPAVYDDGVNGPLPVAEIGEEAFMNCANLYEISVPDSITVIDTRAFAFTRIGAIDLPEGLSAIGDYAFAFCEGLTEVTIPESVTSLGEYAFSYCTSLEVAHVGAQIEDLPVGCFIGRLANVSSGTYYDGKLTTIHLPGTLKRMHREALYIAQPLKDIYFGGSEEEWAQVEIYYFEEGEDEEDGIVRKVLSKEEKDSHFSNVTLHFEAE